MFKSPTEATGYRPAASTADWQWHRLMKKIYIVFAALLAIVGCAPGGDPRVAVTGHVTYKGAPVSGASIFFIPDIDKEGYGANALIWNGRYSIPAELGPTAGELNVIIVDARHENPNHVPDAQSPLVPRHFANMGGLRVVIPPRHKSFSYDFELSDEPDTPRRPLEAARSAE